MSFPVIALTKTSGPVILRTCHTRQEQQRFFRRALETKAMGGYADVLRIYLDSSEDAPPPPSLQNFRQEAMEL